jgi:hypothetical protein
MQPGTEGGATTMPQQGRTYHSNRTEADEEKRAEMDALIDQAMDEAIADAKDHPRAVAAEAGDWLDSIDEAIKDWAESDQLAQAFVDSFVQKGGQ